MVVVGDFCLLDCFFPRCPGNSFLFCESDLAKLNKKGYSISAYWEETPKSMSAKEETQKSPHTKEHTQKPSHNKEEPHKSCSKALGTSLPQAVDSMSVSKSFHKTKHSPPAKEHKTNMTMRTATPIPSMTGPMATKVANIAPTGTVAVLQTKGTANAAIPQTCMLPL